MEGIAPFIGALRRILGEDHYDTIRWSTDGLCVEILDVDVLVKKLLPRYGFRQSKWASFQRQLNYFGFRKRSRAVTKLISYYNTFFCRNRPEDMRRIFRRKNVLSSGGSQELRVTPIVVEEFSSLSSLPMPCLPLTAEELDILQLVANFSNEQDDMDDGCF